MAERAPPDDQDLPPQLIWNQLQHESIHYVLYLTLIAGIVTVAVNEGLRGTQQTNFVGLALIVLAAAARALLQVHYRVSAGVLLVGTVTVLITAMFAQSNPGIWILFTIPTLAGLWLASPMVSVGVAAVATGAWWVYSGGALPPLPSLVLLWGSLILVWVFLHMARGAMVWSWQNYRYARHLLDETRAHRTELEEVREDLIAANRQLARMSKRLNALVQVAEEARQAKDEFLANVSHELRTPLNMIIGFSEMITQAPRLYGAPVPQALLADIATIQRNSQHLAHLVNDVLDLSQAEVGRMSLSKRWSSLLSIIEAAITSVQPLYKNKGLFLSVDAPDDLPALYCDETRIRQVLLNLLSNAGRFTERGGVSVSAQLESGSILLTVRDTGPGIPNDKLALIFEPFVQIDNSLRRRYDGSGLGLSISRQFVELHGGKMWLESQVDVGTTVYARLPISSSGAVLNGDVTRWFTPYHPYEERGRDFKAPTPLLAPRYVVLETQATLSKLLTQHLDGVEITVVATVEEALAELTRCPATALLVNDPDGLHSPGCQTWLTKVPYGTVALNCWVPGIDSVSRELGVVDYLVKPIALQDFLAAIEALGESVESVLLVDDDPEALQLFGRMLASSTRTYRLLRASNAQRALELMRTRRPDVLVLDLVMPEVDGFEVLRQKARDAELRSIPTLVLSSQDPVRTPIISNMLTVTRGGGLSAKDLVTSLQSITQSMQWQPKPTPSAPFGVYEQR